VRQLLDPVQWDPPAEPEPEDALLAAFARVLREAEGERPILRVVGCDAEVSRHE